MVIKYHVHHRGAATGCEPDGPPAAPGGGGEVLQGELGGAGGGLHAELPTLLRQAEETARNGRLYGNKLFFHEVN